MWVGEQLGFYMSSLYLDFGWMPQYRFDFLAKVILPPDITTSHEPIVVAAPVYVCNS